MPTTCAPGKFRGCTRNNLNHAINALTASGHLDKTGTEGTDWYVVRNSIASTGSAQWNREIENGGWTAGHLEAPQRQGQATTTAPAEAGCKEAATACKRLFTQPSTWVSSSTCPCSPRITLPSLDAADHRRARNPRLAIRPRFATTGTGSRSPIR